MEWFVLQLRALKDGGLDYTVDDLIEALERTPVEYTLGSHKEMPPKFDTVIERLQTIARSRARKAA